LIDGFLGELLVSSRSDRTLSLLIVEDDLVDRKALVRALAGSTLGRVPTREASTLIEATRASSVSLLGKPYTTPAGTIDHRGNPSEASGRNQHQSSRQDAKIAKGKAVRSCFLGVLCVVARDIIPLMSWTCVESLRESSMKDNVPKDCSTESHGERLPCRETPPHVTVHTQLYPHPHLDTFL